MYQVYMVFFSVRKLSKDKYMEKTQNENIVLKWSNKACANQARNILCF